ncbi:gliding motility-associated C-terminal domain-containing protein [Taibaiella koreensis]|uniref:gliding motility-associated C-terminal domain-containing protein n=1 Tax=Taibaiella koreensis TaxID=1268548 RepID=UPI0013C2C96D|nr:gliding motility-associated C-terminal domain-containing protein [Taibaiella koreensis]
MTYKIHALTSLFLLCAVIAGAQPDHQLNANKKWVFGNHAGLDFVPATPAGFPVNIEAVEGTSSVADGSGQLLLYATLDTVWDRNGAIMPNGGGLLPTLSLTGLGSISSCDAQSFIVPFPGDTKKYYVFSLTSYSTSTTSAVPGNDPAAGRLYYSVVDMGLNGGLGDVVAGQKGIQIDSLLCDRLIAVKGGACNIWVVAMRNDGSAIHAFEIGTAGINIHPVVSLCSNMVGTLDISPLFQLNSGCMRVSPDNKTLAISLSGVAAELVLSPFALNLYGGSFQLYDFDNVTGAAGNQRTVLPPPSTMLSFDQQVYNVCFSPDNTKLYLTHGLLLGLGLSQYDITSGVPGTIAASAVELNSSTIGWGSGLRLGPDDKVYVSGTDMSLLGLIPASTLHRIESPNLAGAAANLVLNAVTLAPGSIAAFGLGNPVPGLPPVDTTFNTHNVAVCAPETTADLSVPQDPAYTYLWDDGSTGNTRTVPAPGTYWVMYGPVCPKIFDTFKVEAVDVRFHLGSDTIICTAGFAYVLDPGVQGASYVWQDGSTDPVYTATKEGQYYAVVSQSGCTASDTVNITVTDLKQDLGKDTVVCQRQPFAISLNAAVPPGASVQWSTGSTDPGIVVTHTGKYSVRVTKDGCEGLDDYIVNDEMCDCIAGMPNAFSPNGDGLNDVFAPVIEAQCKVAGYLFNVFNRWGELVFSTTVPGAGWDGTHKGSPAASGNYMFTIAYEKGTQHHSYVLKGDVTLIR